MAETGVEVRRRRFDPLASLAPRLMGRGISLPHIRMLGSRRRSPRFERIQRDGGRLECLALTARRFRGCRFVQHRFFSLGGGHRIAEVKALDVFASLFLQPFQLVQLFDAFGG